jgi:guanylate kinase
VQGAGQVRKSCPDAFTIFLNTPAGTYEERLRDRKTESEEQIQSRLQTARDELARVSEFDVQLLNDCKDRAAAELIGLIGRQFDSHQGR